MLKIQVFDNDHDSFGQKIGTEDERDTKPVRYRPGIENLMHGRKVKGDPRKDHKDNNTCEDQPILENSAVQARTR